MLDSKHGGCHKTLEESLDILVEAGVLDGDRGLPGECEDHVHQTACVRDDLSVDVGRVFEPGIGGALAVDQLEDPDDLVLVIFHREGQHRFRAVPVLLVDRSVERVVDVRGEKVDVVDDERFTHARHVASDAGGVERDGELYQRNVWPREVLRELEPETPFAAVQRFD